jgi:hypothetical protein
MTGRVSARRPKPRASPSRRAETRPSPLPPGEVGPKVRVRAFRAQQRRRIHSSWTMPEPYRTTVTLSRILFLDSCWDGETVMLRPAANAQSCHCRARPGNPDFIRPPAPAIGTQGQGLDCRVKPGNDRRGSPFAMPSRRSASPRDGSTFALWISRYLSELSLPGSARQSRLPSTIRPAMSAQGGGLDCRVEPGNDRRGRPFAMPSRRSASPEDGPAFALWIRR